MTVEFQVPGYMTDVRKRMKVSSFMKYAQDIGTFDSNATGFGYDELIRMDSCWIISRMDMIFDRIPLWMENVVLETWHRGLHGPFFVRDYTLRTKSGESLVRATSSWVVLNLKDRSLVRVDKLQDFYRVEAPRTDSAIETPAQKIVFPRGSLPETVRTHTATFSELDYNGHVNNTQYLDWAMDSIDSRMVTDKDIAEASVNFNHEIRLGERVEFQMVANGSEHFVNGITDKGQAFISKLVFRD